MDTTSQSWQLEADEPSLDVPWDELLDGTGSVEDPRSDCCVAATRFRVLLPASSSRPNPAHLRLCGHHYFRSRATLAAISATVFDHFGLLVPTSD